MNSYSTSWWSLLLIYRPREGERLSWPCWLTYSGWFTHINGYPSAAGPVQTSENSPVRDRRSTTEPPSQLATRAHRAVLISVSIALSQTPAEAASPRTWGQCVAWSACLAPSLRWYQFILPGEQRHMTRRQLAPKKKLKQIVIDLVPHALRIVKLLKLLS